MYRSRYGKPPLAASCCHEAKDLTNFTGDRRTNEQTDKQTDRQTEGRRHRCIVLSSCVFYAIVKCEFFTAVLCYCGYFIGVGGYSRRQWRVERRRLGVRTTAGARWRTVRGTRRCGVQEKPSTPAWTRGTLRCHEGHALRPTMKQPSHDRWSTLPGYPSPEYLPAKLDLQISDIF